MTARPVPDHDHGARLDLDAIRARVEAQSYDTQVYRDREDLLVALERVAAKADGLERSLETAPDVQVSYRGATKAAVKHIRAALSGDALGGDQDRTTADDRNGGEG